MTIKPLGKFFLRCKADKTSYCREVWMLKSGNPRCSEPYLALLYEDREDRMIDPFCLQLFKHVVIGEVYETA